ncbi:restriction endonuclease PLD domain-containing protein [Bacillus thuringiensis]|uniref:restriction endonuclease PLD domain-containing protein n=1 Tax=Bacillus thuringiensis TaxID=1428 RepID=UPI0021E945A0|nr:restriction endonuclease PLD domain-containing protein [Bacillus thuringiensis]
MLFTDNLETKIFTSHQYFTCDELIIISGYVGPNPVQRLRTLPINSTVIYGMFGSESISNRLHDTLINIHNPPHINILYSNIPIHSKCYIWKNNGNIVYALIGSANFSTNGLNIPFRENLAETTIDTFSDLDTYLNQILSNTVDCTSATLTPRDPIPPSLTDTKNICNMVLYDPSTGEVQLSSGLNWGHSLKGHNNPGDGYIPIRRSHIRAHPQLFPPKQVHPIRDLDLGRSNRQNDPIELIWDDGILMNATLEGSQLVNGRQYPKNLCSFPNKNLLGIYIRERLGLSFDELVTRRDLLQYGRDDIHLSLLQDGTYYADFSV